jgi:hypothetical protein
MNPAYLQLLQQKGLTNRVPCAMPNIRTLSQTPPTLPQVALRPQGFGGHFEDTPPFQETKTDNGIERLKKPQTKKKKRKKKKK